MNAMRYKMTYKFGLIGEKLGHSLSPQLHNEIMKAKGVTGTYDLIEIPRAEFAPSFATLKTGGYHGVNVTIPYKELVIPYLDILSPQASAIGAVNTIAFSKGSATGYNTDYDGFLSLLSVNSMETRDKSVALLGSGGVTKAVIRALLDQQARDVTIVSTSGKRILDLPTMNYVEFIKNRRYYDLLINCTPVGMYPDLESSPIPASAINAGAVIDLIYNPQETLLLRDASALGIKTANGLHMLRAQAEKAQEIWLSDHS